MQRLLDYIKPDFVHVMSDGQIACQPVTTCRNPPRSRVGRPRARTATAHWLGAARAAAPPRARGPPACSGLHLLGPRGGAPSPLGCRSQAAAVPAVPASRGADSRHREPLQVRSGGAELALELERDGYAFLDKDEKAFK